ncbi:hypothetical protein JCM17478_00470 [Thermopirellula anaerolimosa]
MPGDNRRLGGATERKTSCGREPAVDSLFLFTARPFDPDTGLQNNLHRWYDPAVGRWLSEDPLGFAVDDMNLYRYVSNIPVSMRDALGLYCGECRPPASGFKNEYRKKVVDVVPTSGANPDAMSAVASIEGASSVLSLIQAAGGITSGALTGGLREALEQLVAAIADAGLSSFGGGAGAVDAAYRPRGYRLWLKVEYENCEPCSCWFGMVSGYEFVKHHRWVPMYAPHGASLFPGYYGGPGGRGPTVEEVLHAIDNALK